MSFAAESGGGWGVVAAAGDDTWNSSPTTDWGQKDSVKQSGDDNFGSRYVQRTDPLALRSLVTGCYSSFNNENDPNFASDEHKQSGCFNCGEDG